MNDVPGDSVHAFHDRREAGRLLAGKLSKYAGRNDVVVLGLPRGGVPVAFEIAKTLRAPLDVFVVRKLGVPGQEELAMGAIASGGILDINEDVVRQLHIPARIIEDAARKEDHELQRRESEYRDGRAAIDVRGRTVILVDDGLATGSSMRAAALALKKKQPSQIVVTVPVAPRETCAEFESIVDEVLCAITPESFRAVGEWYEDFSQTTDEQVRSLLEESAEFSAPGPTSS
ncbi:MAG TPA: phosphoribosyltransferase [Candidatus Acidoferrales bacterium]|jgi:predicted phosphoribosyltransferase|nr:phosphoribosyltransferase [Candidatus Acidoferrales bacterium]